MERKQPLSYYGARNYAERISISARLRTEFFEYDSLLQRYYVVVYDGAGRVVDTLDTQEDALDLLNAYKKKGQENHA